MLHHICPVPPRALHLPRTCCWHHQWFFYLLPSHLPPLHPQVEHLDVPEAGELRKLKLLKEELGELAAQGGWQGGALLALVVSGSALGWCATGAQLPAGELFLLV